MRLSKIYSRSWHEPLYLENHPADRVCVGDIPFKYGLAKNEPDVIDVFNRVMALGV